MILIWLGDVAFNLWSIPESTTTLLINTCILLTYMLVQIVSLIVLCCFPDHFSQIEDDSGLLNFPKFEAYLRELLQVCLSFQLHDNF